jgi:hypothetical protein
MELVMATKSEKEVMVNILMQKVMTRKKKRRRTEFPRRKQPNEIQARMVPQHLRAKDAEYAARTPTMVLALPERE